ncbi:MAG TPA: hypothetical protein VIQ53_03800 [Inquilinus sp.]
MPDLSELLPDGQSWLKPVLRGILEDLLANGGKWSRGYDTYAEMQADLSPENRIIVRVGDLEPDPAKRGLYRKNGPPGPGSSWIFWGLDTDTTQDERISDVQALIDAITAAAQVLPGNGLKVVGSFEAAGAFFQLVTNHHWKWAIVGTDRRVIIGKDKDNKEWQFGRPIDELRPAWLTAIDERIEAAVGEAEAKLPPVYLDGGKAYEVGPKLILDPAPRQFLWRADRVGGMVRTIINRPYLALQTEVAIGKLLRIAMPCDPTVLHVILRIGQSTAPGFRGFPLSAGMMVNPYPTKVLKVAGLDVRLGLPSNATLNPVLNPALITGFDPLVSMQGSDAGCGVTSCEAMGSSMVEAIGADTGLQPMVLQLVVARGGLAYSELKKDTIPWDNSIAALGAIREVAEGLGWKVAMPWIDCNHGQANGNDPGYYNMQVEWQGDYSVAIRNLFDQEAEVPFNNTLPSAYTDGWHHSALAMVRLMEDFPDLFTVACPEYHLTYDPDLTHPDAAGYMLRGRYESRAGIQQAFGTAGPWKPLWVPRTAWTFDGTTLVLSPHIPVAPLRFDTAAFPNPGNYGFRAFDGNRVLPIATVTLINSATQIAITFGRAVVGNARIEYATKGYGDPKVIAAKPGGCLFDSANPDPNPCLQMSIAFA